MELHDELIDMFDQLQDMRQPLMVIRNDYRGRQEEYARYLSITITELEKFIELYRGFILDKYIPLKKVGIDDG